MIKKCIFIFLFFTLIYFGWKGPFSPYAVKKVIDKQLSLFGAEGTRVEAANLGWKHHQLNGVSFDYKDFTVVSNEIKIKHSISSILTGKSVKNLQIHGCTVFYKGEKLFFFEEVRFDPETKALHFFGQENGIIHIAAYLDQRPLIEVSLQNANTSLVQKLLPDLPIEELTGETFSIIASIYPDTTDTKIDLKVNSPNLYFTTAGLLEEGKFRLTMPLTGSFFLSEELSKKVFTHNSLKPISKSPIYIAISPEGTSIPISDFSWDQVQIPRMVLEPGHMECAHFYALNVILGLFNQQIHLGSTVPLSFRKAHMAIKDGVCTFERTEFLVEDKYELAASGFLNLASHEIDMNVVLTAKTLEKVFSFKDLRSDYTVSIHITGKAEEPSYHVEEALFSLGALAIINQQW